MSSPTSTGFLLPSPTNGSDGSSGTTQTGANYFFGFLITFVGILVIFVVCGLGSRRRFARRRAAALNGTLEPLPHFSNGKLGEDSPPHLHEQLLVIGEDKWSNLMPLSVRFWREEKEEEESNPPAHDLEALPPATAATTDRIFPSFLLPNRFSIHKNPSLPTDHDLPDTIQVAVMIIMPSRDPSHPDYKTPERLPEYQIGSINLPWQQRYPNP